MNQMKKPPRKLMALWAALTLAVMVFPMPAFAADDPLTIVNNLGDFSSPASGPLASSSWAGAWCRWP